MAYGTEDFNREAYIRGAREYEEYIGQTLAFHKGLVNAFVNTMQVNDSEEGMCHRRPVE